MKPFTNYFLLSTLLVLLSTSLWGERNSEQNLTDSDIASIKTDRWMEQMWGYLNTRTLDEISLPGSHDSGMNKDNIHTCRLGTVTNTATQNGNIEYQLNKGSRYFDIRPAVIEPDKYNGTRWATAHVDDVAGNTLGCEGESLESIREGLHNFFLDPSHSSELVVLKISHCGEEPSLFSSGFQCSDTELKYIASSLNVSKLLIKFNESGTDTLKTMPLEALIAKGNVLLLVDGASEPEKGIFSVGSDCGDDYYLYDEYSDSNDYTTMKNDQKSKLKTSANHSLTCDGEEYRKNFLLSWTLTLSTSQILGGSPSILDIASDATPKLEEEIKGWIGTKDISKKYFPNIIYIDAVDSEATRSAMYVNLHYETLEDN
jgi:hypothetical protein